MRRKELLPLWCDLQPQVWVVTAVPNKSLVVGTDYLGVAQWGQDGAIEVSHGLHAGA